MRNRYPLHITGTNVGAHRLNFTPSIWESSLLNLLSATLADNFCTVFRHFCFQVLELWLLTPHPTPPPFHQPSGPAVIQMFMGASALWQSAVVFVKDLSWVSIYIVNIIYWAQTGLFSSSFLGILDPVTDKLTSSQTGHLISLSCSPVSV